jgi:hypothetical protein
VKFSGFKRILKEDLAKAGGEIPKWLDTFLSPLNQLIENVGQALQNRLNFGDNFYCKEVTISLTSNVEQEINPTTPFAPQARAYGLLVLSSSGQKISNYVWNTKTNGNVSLTVTFATASDANCTLLLLLR